MNSLSLPYLRDTADQFATLAGVMQAPPSETRAHAIRKADKCLVALEAFFTTQLTEEAYTWVRACEALNVLSRRMAMIEKHDEEARHVLEEIAKLEQLNTKWSQVPQDERSRLLTQARTAKHYLDSQMDLNEAHILHRYHRLKALQPLVPYADNAEVLCEAIHHFQNSERYEENIQKLKAKVENAGERLRSVKRGFYLAVCLCLLLVTIPLCLPFAFSLWARRREIQKQIANTRESIRREERRLVAAEEGVIAYEEIKEVLGDIPLEQIRQVLAEVRDLRSEFMGSQVASSQTANLLGFMESAKQRLEDIFGPVPTEPPACFKWLVEKIYAAEHNQTQLSQLRATLEAIRNKTAQLLKGHGRQLLEKSIFDLVERKQSNLFLPLDDELKFDFADLAIHAPNTLRSCREALWQLSRCQPVDDAEWKSIQTKLKSMSNVFNACVVNLEVLQLWGGPTVAEDEQEDLAQF